MISYLLKVWVLLIFSGVIIFYYYSNGAHIENFDGYLPYIISMLGLYGTYKYMSLSSLKETIVFSPAKIGGFFLLHLLLLSVLFFHYNGGGLGDSLGNGITLFLKILFYSFLPTVLVLISLAFGKKILGMVLEGYKHKSAQYQFLTGIGFGFFAFVFLLTILGMIGAYNLGAVFGILGVFILFSYKELGGVLSGIWNYKIENLNHKMYSKNFLEQVNPQLLTREFFFIIITLILSINLISVFRPFPIGWDDLGAYMNFPHLMASSGYIGELGSMMSWQTFTGIGYMFSNPTLAFFLNNVGGFLSVIAIVIITGEFFKNKKNTFIDLPLLSATLFISMPMIVFQQAKDMKLDAGLFFISIIALYMLFEFYAQYLKNKEVQKLLSKKGVLKLFLVIGLLLGFTFTIKFTSLLLISAVFGILFYTRLGILGFLGYLSLYFAVFTAGGFWKMMNVVALDTPEMKQTFSFSAIIIGIVFLITARVQTKKRFRKFIPRIIALSIGMIIAILPWAMINLASSDKISVSSLLSGKSEVFQLDYTKVYSPEELEIIEKTTTLRGLTSSGTTTNEDFGRYFGYEKGINNYVKLPWNLTMQNNQGGEFTTIGFLFLALLPTLLLFLPFRKKGYAIGVYTLILFEILLFVIPPTRDFFTGLMASVSLPYGYIFILLLALIPLIFFIPTLQKKELTKLFKINLIFAVFYSFLWGISAFGIVWYGIVMYFNFILLIIFGVYYLGGYRNNDSDQEKGLRFFGTLVFISIVGIYISFSVFPHSFANLKNAGYTNYKLGKTTIAEAPFLFHREYLPILFSLNISEEKRELFIKDSIQSEQIRGIVKNNGLENNIVGIQQLLKQIMEDERVDIPLRKSAQLSLQKLYKNISEPNEEYKNTKGIYRIGTFLKYHISENNKRLLEDSLIMRFDTYMYDENADITVERMKKLGVHYFLVDLNAATIDKDPRHALTGRYQKLLSTFISNDLELIDTDSICLKIGLENYKKNGDKEEYISLAGVNYEWHKEDGEVIGRGIKQLGCYKKISSLIDSGEVTEDSYAFLAPYASHLSNMETEKEKFTFLHKYVGHGYKVLFRIK